MTFPKSVRIIAQFFIIMGNLLPGIIWGATSPSSHPVAATKTPTKPSIPLTSLTGQNLYDHYPWSVLYYYGWTVSNPLIDVLTLHDLQRWPETIQSFELAYTLSEQNPVRRFFNPIVGVIQLAGNFTVRDGKNEPTIYEFDPYMIFRWANFPWNKYLNTSFALAEGVSYVTSVPAVEKKDNDNTKRFLNYLIVELTFAAAEFPRLQLVARIHHRSGAFGLYHAGNTGSNDLGLGLRYLFD